MVYVLVDRGGGFPNLSDPQAFKTVSLQMMVYGTSTFRRIFYKNCTTFKFLMLDMNGESGSFTLLPLSRKFAAFTSLT